MKRLVFLPIAAVLCGFLNSWTDAAYTDDPARCKSAHPGACDAAIGDALASFPYWNYRAVSDTGNGTHFFLGTEAGYLWAVTCQHCSVPATWEFQSGPWAGQQFDTYDYNGNVGVGAAYRQFGQGDGPPLYVNAGGDLLVRLVPKPGKSLPNVPFVRLLPGLERLDDGDLVLAIGNGQTGTHPTLGWFAECGTTSAGGMPAGGRPACCTEERVAGNYRPSEACSPPSTATNAVCYGGEGNFATCSAARLTYLGPVWESSPSAPWHWATWNYLSRDVVTTDFGGSFLQIIPTIEAVDPATGDSPTELGRCVTFNGAPSKAGYLPRKPPAHRVKTQMMCSSNDAGGKGVGTPSQGDSGSANFVYIDGVWFFTGTGIWSSTLHTIPQDSQADWARWIYGATSDHDGDLIPDSSDNCIFVKNGAESQSLQCDTDEDGYGNACDGDFDENDTVTGSDSKRFSFQTGVDPAVGTDMDCNGALTGRDFTDYFVPSLKRGKPGPSGLYRPR